MIRLSSTALALMLLSGCSSEAEADPAAWAVALEDVPGVASAEVEYEKFGPGYRADVVVRTETNDLTNLEQILRASLERFVEVTADMDTFGIEYSAETADGTRGLDPANIGLDSRTIGFLRDSVAAEPDSSPSSAP